MARRLSRQAWANIIAIAVGACLVYVFTRPWMPSSAKLNDVLSRTEATVAQIKVRGDVGFWFGQGAMLGHRQVSLNLMPQVSQQEDGLLSQLDYRFWQLRDVRFPSLAGVDVKSGDKSFDPSKLLDASDMDSPGRTTQALQLVKSVMECLPGKGANAGLLRAEPDYGYIATHQFFGLLVARHRGCIGKPEFTRRAAAYAKRVYSEMHDYSGPLTDVQVERAAMLSLVGKADVVPVSMINDLIKAQRPDGMWYFHNGGGFNANVAAHNSALAYLVLAATYGRLTNGNDK